MNHPGIVKGERFIENSPEAISDITPCETHEKARRFEKECTRTSNDAPIEKDPAIFASVAYLPIVRDKEVGLMR